MKGIFYLHPKSNTWKTKPPACWCRATAAWACLDGVSAKADYLCGAHMPAWAQTHDMKPGTAPEPEGTAA